MKRYHQVRPAEQRGFCFAGEVERIFDLPDNATPPPGSEPVSDETPVYEWRPVVVAPPTDPTAPAQGGNP